MRSKLFISYSRRQTPFIDRLTAELENIGYSIWLDYRSLVPARPWKEQINDGIAGSDVVLLVVSREALGSDYVEYEWRRALALEKRIVLIIFEAVPLPSELKTCQWVDLRTDYKHGFQILTLLLEWPSPRATLPPEKGFRAPLTFWIVQILTVVVAIGSVPAFWTLFVPYVLVPLVWKVFQRNYSLSRVLLVLIVQPFVLMLSVVVAIANPYILAPIQFPAFICLVPTSLASWLLAALLLTPAMQRRGLPEAAWTRFAHPLVIEDKKPAPVTFAIDHAPEDSRYASELRRGLERYGHRPAVTGESPESIFVLISAYKTRTDYDPGRQTVYPVILQPVGEIDSNLQRIQWIDFRKGIRKIDQLAQLLPEPERLLRVLAVPPTGTQEIYPLAVTILQYSYFITGGLGVGALLVATVSLGIVIFIWNTGQDSLPNLFLAILNNVLAFGTALLCVRALRSRKGGIASFYPLVILTLSQVGLHFVSLGVLTLVPLEGDPSNSRFLGPELSMTAGIPIIFLYPVTLVAVVLTLIFGWRDLYRWLPQSQGVPRGDWRLSCSYILHPVGTHSLCTFFFTSPFG